MGRAVTPFSTRTGSPVLERLARHRVRASVLVTTALVLEWQLDDGGRAHSLLTWGDMLHPAGVLLIGLGVLLRSWAAGVIAKRSRLATRGPYGLVRHPLYLGSLIIALGLVAIMEDPLALASLPVVFCVLYVPAIVTEERRLAARFSIAWEMYAGAIPMFLPRALTLHRTAADWSWRQWLRNKEWRVPLGAVLVITLLELLEWWNP